MFVSSYSTFIQTNNSDKNIKQKVEQPSKSTESFSNKLKSSIGSVSYTTSNLPISYISQSQVLNNKNELEAQSKQLKEPQDKNQEKTQSLIGKYTAQNSLISAKSSYEAGSIKIFSVMRKPQVALNQTPSIENSLPNKPQEVADARELTMRHKMVNTYIANDNYYKVTA